MWAAYHNYGTITTLEDVVHLTLELRRCLNRACSQFRRTYRSAAEGRLALPKHALGLEVIVWASVPCALRRTVVGLKSLSTCTTVGWPSHRTACS
jgi:hypothetical protein